MLEQIRPDFDKFFFQYQPHYVRDIVEDKELAADAEAYIKATGQDTIFDNTMPIIARKKMARKTLDNIAMRLYDTRATIGMYVNKLKRNKALRLQQVKLEVDPIDKEIQDKGQYFSQWAEEYLLKKYSNYKSILQKEDKIEISRKNIKDAKKHILREYLDHTNYELMYLET